MIKSLALYFRDCFALPIYRNFFVAWVLSVCASACVGPFSILFSRESLRLSMDDMGSIYAWGSVASALTYFPMGWLCDLFSPFRVALVSVVGFVALLVTAFFVIDGKSSLLVFTALQAVCSVGWTLGMTTATMKLFPNGRFAEFSSGMNVFGCGALILGNYLIGRLMDFTHSNYRVTFLWSAAFYALAIYPVLLAYNAWRRHGGPDHYVPPDPSRRA